MGVYGYDGFSVQVRLSNRDFDITSAVLVEYLPMFPPGPRIDVQHLHHSWSKALHKAYRHLLTHLEEISKHGISTALLHGLEASWSSTSQERQLHPRSFRPHDTSLGAPSTCELFESLAYLLHLHAGHPLLTCALATFFIRHCDAIFARSTTDGILCLRMLEKLNLDTSDVIECIARKPTLVDTIVTTLNKMELMCGEFPLSSELCHLLGGLTAQKEARVVSRPGLSSRGLIRPRPYEVGGLYGGGRRARGGGAGGLTPGDAFPSRQLNEICKYERERVFIAPRRGDDDYGAAGRFLEDYDGIDSAEEEEAFAGRDGRRRTGSGWGAPRRRLEGGFDDMSYAGGVSRGIGWP